MRFTRSHTLTEAPARAWRAKANSVLRRGLLTLLAGAAMLGFAHPIYSQSPMEQAIAASFPLTKATADRSDIVTAGSVMTLKKDNIIMFATTAAVRSSLNYKDGKISPSMQTRLAAFSITGRPATNIVQRTYVAGEKLWLIGVQSASDGVTLQFLSDAVGDNRYTTSIKFPFPKGATPTPQQVIAQIGEVISADGGAPAAAPAPEQPAEPAIVPPPPPGGPSVASGTGWRVQNTKDGNEAAIGGVGLVNGRKGPVVMALSCKGAEVRLHRSMAPTDATTFFCMDMDGGYDVAKFKVGERPFEQGSICGDDDTSTPVLKLPIDLGVGGLEQFLSSPGSPVIIKIGLTDKPAGELTAQFQLPQDPSPIQYLQSCLKPVVDTPKPWVNSCPTLAGKGLRKADLLTASGKPYTGTDPENTIGIAWDIPKATKAHPVRPKLTWACYYGEGARPGDDSTEPLQKMLVPINEKPSFCTLRGEVALGELAATCSS
jgi:hypothetical protein